MILQLKKPQKAIIRTVKEFAKGKFEKEAILDLDKSGRFPEEIWKNAAELGFLGIHLPEELGGGGMEMSDHMLIAEAFTRHDSTAGSAIMMATVGAEWLALYAPDGLKEKILPDLLEGRIRLGCALPKAGTGLSLSEHENNYIVSGKFDRVINGNNADFYLLPLKEPESGFTLVDSSSDGLSIEKKYQPLGLRMTGLAKIDLSDVHIPKENYIVIKKKSFSFLLAPIRMLIAFLSLGTAQGAIDRAVTYVKGREQFGKKIASFQVLRHKLAVMEISLNQARSLTYMTALAYSAKKKPDTAMTAMACVASVTAATEITHEAIQLMGGYGYTVEYEVERFCRDAKTLQMLSQGTLSLYDDIADSVLGKVR